MKVIRYVYLTCWTSLLFVSSTTGYSNQSTNNPFVHHMGFEDILTKHISSEKQTKCDETKGDLSHAKRYDLGIGKNPLVVYRKKGLEAQVAFSSFSSNNFESARYLVEYHATREYPSPLQQVPISTSTSPKHTFLPNVEHKRHVDDVLLIKYLGTYFSSSRKSELNGSPRHHTSRSLPYVIGAVSDDQLDPNTIWVELMLHTEHIKSISSIKQSGIP